MLVSLQSREAGLSVNATFDLHLLSSSDVVIETNMLEHGDKKSGNLNV